MKKFIVFFISCVMVLAFTACNQFEKPIPILGVISVDNGSYIHPDDLSSQSTEYILEMQQCVANDAVAAIEKSLELKPFAIIINGDVDVAAAIEAVRHENIPIVFIGSVPNITALDGYDKAWYLTANENQGGEMLGFEIGNAFKNDVIVDQNGDDILQCAIIYSLNSSALNSIVQSAEDLGVFSDITEIKIDNLATVNEIIAEKYSSVIAPELLICENEELALAMQAAFAALEQSNIVTFIHKIPTPISITSPPLYNAAQFPYDNIANACKQFVGNILKNESANNNTDIRLDSHKTSVFSYNLIK